VWNFDRTGIPRLSKPSIYIFKSVYNSFKLLVFHVLKAEPGEVKRVFYFRMEEVQINCYFKAYDRGLLMDRILITVLRSIL
jgi:hypothetical protein